MSMGLPYDSDEGRAVAGAIMAMEHCEAYARSAEIAGNPKIGTFDGYEENREPFLEHLTTEDVERIEVLRGPQTTLYGSEAVGGVINIVTKKGEGPPQVTASAEGGSFATFTETASVRGGRGPVSYSLSGTRVDSNGITAQQADDERDRDGYANSTLSARLGVDPHESFGADAYVQYIASKVELDTGDDLSQADTESEQLLVSVAPRLVLFDGLWEQRLRFWLHDVSRDNDGESGFGTLPSDFEGRLYGLDWQNTVQPLDFLTLVGGVELELEEGELSSSTAPDGKVDAHTYGIAGYLDHQLQLWDRVFATAGFRVEEQDEFGTEVTGRGTLALKFPETGTTLRGSVGSAYKTPSLTQFFDDSFGSANPDLEPEESLGFDAGVEQQLFDDRVELSLTWFRNDIQDMILVQDLGGFDFRNVNVEDVKSHGVELGLVLQPIDALRIEGSYTYTETQAEEAGSFGVEEGGELLRRPEHEARLDVTGRFWEDRVSLTTRVLYVGDREDIDPAPPPGGPAAVNASDYWVVDLLGSLRVSERLELFARAENLFDEDYQDVLGFKTPGIAGYGGVRVRLP